MNMTSLGDLAQSLVLRTRSTQLKQSMATLTEELTTGRTSDISGRLGGDYSYLADIERNLARLDGFSLSAREAAIFAGAAQTNLEKLQAMTEGLSGSLISVTSSTIDPIRSHASAQARQDLDSALSALNAGVGGRSLFGGIATDRAPLGSADTLIAALRGAVTGQPTADAVIAAADAWFADPAGFEATLYQGSNQDLAPMQVGPGQQVTLSMRADDPTFRALLRDVALAALATDPALGFGAGLQSDLLRKTGEGLLATQDKVTGLRADLGFAEARIEEASARNASARTGLEYARGALLEADPYETATRLEDVQFQLESLYAVTVRTSKLTLVNFLR